ncbi:heparinase II/III domain-containing protein [Membranihabitans marinus]|uniref:heparinase II/III domain-containing protein n=1 Tax=Membranihabitans marinus TaxID=1227546 RepID=UPI001F004818|nr:heparinase II/III family protein [Membranihabitans marinus]
MIGSRLLYMVTLVLGLNSFLIGQEHPNLLLTAEGVSRIKDECCPRLYQEVLDKAILEFASVLEAPMEVPIPKDMAGGYSHETHKRNYGLMRTAGMLFQITGEEKYGNYVKDMLFKYVELYPRIDKHPSRKSYSPGKLFWQCLNDANWLMYTAQAYDAIYHFLSLAERRTIEEELLIPYADFISIENPKFFNRIHNHSTWGNAAVGMIGLALNNKELIQRALYGLEIKKDISLEKDNDGGLIYDGDRAIAGFFAQIDYAFSPDGYYEEGPYYHRYAMLPFMVFAQGLNHHMPELKIFEYRGGLLIKAVKTMLAQTDSKGEFFPINDAQKGMSIAAGSVVTAVNIAYANSRDKEFLLAAQLQNKVLLDQSGFEISKALENISIAGLQRSSTEMKDGKDGNKGGLGVLRWGGGSEEFNVVYKYTSQGLGHGHFDKLSYSIYDGPTEVLQDYGAARWVNIDQKAGGRYLDENQTWAKQTVAHNALVMDQKSHFDGIYDVAKSGYSIPIYFNAANRDLQIISAKDTMAYKNHDLERLVVLWKDDEFDKPIVIDIVRAFGEEAHDFDLPLHFAGQFLKADFKYQSNDPEILGDSHGYQHIYQEAVAKIENPSISMTWLKDQKMYTLTTKSEINDEVILARIGANDHEFNLRRDAFMIHRKSKAINPSFISVIESHGSYNPVTEIPHQPYGKIKSIESILESVEYSVFDLIDVDNNKWRVCINHYNGESNAIHKIEIPDGHKISWTGPITINKLKN